MQARHCNSAVRPLRLHVTWRTAFSDGKAGFDGFPPSCPLNMVYESNENQASLGRWRLRENRPSHIYVCPFSSIFDKSPVYSNLFRLTALDVWLHANHSAQPGVRYRWFTELAAGIAEASRHVKGFQGIRVEKGPPAQ